MPPQSIIQHPAFIEASQALDRSLDQAQPGQLIFVIGLSGAGKSELRYASMRRFAGDPARWGTGRLPAIAVRATPSDKSNFNPKEFMGRLQLSLRSPNFDWVCSRDQVPSSDIVHLQQDSLISGDLWTHLRKQQSEMAMRAQVENIARARSLRAIFIEEAGSITYVRGKASPGDHMVNYMCLAEEIPVVLVLFGVPRTRALWHGNAEVRRRSRFVFVRRYLRTEAVDREQFTRLVITLAQGYLFEKGASPIKHIDTIYKGFLGVFGELKEFFIRADESRQRADRPAITISDLESAFYADDELRTLYNDAAAFDALAQPAKVKVATRLLEAK